MRPIPSDFALSAGQLSSLASTVRQSYRQLDASATPDDQLEGRPVAHRSVLITGGAGFLGVHLLQQLVDSGRFHKIYLLVRRPETLLPALARYHVNPEVLAGVEVIQGDLAHMPIASLPAVDVVLHSAARIHGLKSLRQLWTDNVVATARLFAHYRGAAKLFFISTLSVFVSSNQNGAHAAHWVRERDELLIYGGYAQSKYICECLARDAGVNVIRLGLLTGSSTLGRFPENDFFSVFLRTMRQLGCAPRGCEEAWVDVTPVDFAATRIVKHLENPARPRIFHVAGQLPVSASFILSKLGLSQVEAAVFKAAVDDLSGIERVLLTYAFFKSEALRQMPSYFNIDLFQSTDHTYCIDDAFPRTNDELVSLYVSVADA